MNSIHKKNLKIRYCSNCRNHGITSAVKGHKKKGCPYELCPCNDCETSRKKKNERRRVTQPITSHEQSPCEATREAAKIYPKLETEYLEDEILITESEEDETQGEQISVI